MGTFIVLALLSLAVVVIIGVDIALIITPDILRRRRKATREQRRAQRRAQREQESETWQ